MSEHELLEQQAKEAFAENYRHWMWQPLWKLFGALSARRRELEEAIRTHRSQKADDRCIDDDDRLYEVLGDGIRCDRAVGDKDAMLANCARFIDRRCEGGGWPTYVELEADLERQNDNVARLVASRDGREKTWREGMDALLERNRQLNLRVVKLEKEVASRKASDELWERGTLASMKRAEELLGAGPFDNVDHAAERVMARMEELKKALRAIVDCSWDCAAPGQTCQDRARAALAAPDPKEKA